MFRVRVRVRPAGELLRQCPELYIVAVMCCIFQLIVLKVAHLLYYLESV